jgi:RHS repeat-associated protein
LINTHNENRKIKSAPTTQLVSNITYSDNRTIDYEYDAEDRITKVTDSVDGVTTYVYDSLGQLVSETRGGTTVNVEYDNYGNITKKNGVTYTYGDYVWKDKLTSYGGRYISYDAQGNPTTYLGHTLNWEKGRQLKTFDSYSYTYNANGIRTGKFINGDIHEYTLDGTKILRETWADNSIIPLYDYEESVCGIIYNSVPYYFVKNLQGDIISITNSAGTVVARYTYDAWGVCTITSDTSGVSIATINPFRYRGYYYDTESGMYYLQSRYYDPAVGRFINADDSRIINMFYGITIVNIYTYCENNPVKNIDPTGYLVWPGQIHDFVQSVLALYIWIYLGCFTHINYFIRFSLLNYGFADLYAEKWNEIWEVKPDKTRYYTSGPKQLAKYIGAVDGAKVGRNLGLFTTYYYDNTGLYKVDIRSDSSDGMIYYKYSYCWKVTAAILILVGSIVLLKTGVGAGVGAKGLAAAAKLLLV